MVMPHMVLIPSGQNVFIRFVDNIRRCDLCLTEKTIIALADPKVLLNKRTELIYFEQCQIKITRIDMVIA